MLGTGLLIDILFRRSGLCQHSIAVIAHSPITPGLLDVAMDVDRLAEKVRRGLEVGARRSSARALLCSCCILATERSPNLNSAPGST